MRIIGYGAQGAAARNRSLCILLYLIPLAGAGVALLDIAGFDPRHSSTGRAAAPRGAGNELVVDALPLSGAQFLAGVGIVFAAFVSVLLHRHRRSVRHTAGKHVPSRRDRRHEPVAAAHLG
jgi:hypothetical protein